MIKSRELSDPTSCLNRAADNELIFVLLARDITAPDTVRYWVSERLRKGKNGPDDPQIVEALEWADKVEGQRMHVASDHDPKDCWHCQNAEVRP